MSHRNPRPHGCRRASRLVAAAALVAAVALPAALTFHGAPAWAQTPPAFVLAWGGAGVKAGNLMAPRALALDKDGNVYVADKSGRLQKFGPDGKPLHEWGGSSDMERMFQEPAAAAVAPDGAPLVADVIMIRKYDAEGESVERWIAGQPQGIAVTGSGAFYATDARGARVELFDGPGRPKQTFGKPGSGDGEFSFPAGIALDGKGNLYVADSGNNRVQKFASDGAFIAAWGKPGTGPGQFDSPQGVAVDRSGNVYVVDQKNSRVQAFTADGKFLLQWGTKGTGNGQFDSPTSIAIDRRGNIYVADTGNNRVQKFAVK